MTTPPSLVEAYSVKALRAEPVMVGRCTMPADIRAALIHRRTTTRGGGGGGDPVDGHADDNDNDHDAVSRDVRAFAVPSVRVLREGE